MTQTKLEFDPVAHRYTVDGNPVPSFSYIKKTMGIGDNAFYTGQGREEGTALHSWLIFLASSNEPSESPDPRIAGRVEGIRKFLAESGFIFVGGEKPLCEPTLRYACTPDLWGHLGGFLCVIEAKRGAKEPWHKLQTSCQYLALRANGFAIQKRYALYLKDGGYKLEEHTDLGDMARWRALVAAHYAKEFYK